MTDLPATLEDSARRWPHPDAELKRAELRKWILQGVPKGGVGAEIGTFRGHFAEALLKRLAPAKLYLVDPWMLAADETDGGFEGGPRLPAAAARQEAAWRAAAFPGTDCRLVDGFFPRCKTVFEEPLDFLYLGTGRGFEDTRQHLRIADRLLAPKGLLLGDDWWPDPESPRHGVFRAVNLFAKNNGYDVVAAGPFGQWAIRRRSDWQPAEEVTAGDDADATDDTTDNGGRHVPAGAIADARDAGRERAALPVSRA